MIVKIHKCTFLAMVLTLVGCATIPKQPEILDAGVVPALLQPGDEAIVRAEFQDQFGIVSRVEGTIPDDPSIVFRLKDNGVTPDMEANDDVWTLRVDVPFNAPPGEFQLTLTAYDSDGHVILIQDKHSEAAPLSVVCTLTIEFKDE